MNRHARVKIEGFWHSKHEPDLPKPVPREQVDPQKDVFVKALAKRELTAQKILYRGWSTCRICGIPNGSEEFVTDRWVWPSGYRHYVEVHNVWPSNEFKEYIL